MIEVDTTYLWQTPSGVDAEVPCVSAPVFPLPRPQFVLALANMGGLLFRAHARTRTCHKARFPLTPGRFSVSPGRHESAAFPVTGSFPAPASGAPHRAPISGLRTAPGCICADKGISIPAPAFLVFKNQISAA